LCEGAELGEAGTEEGYRAWAATYVEPDNPLIGVEKPLVRRILDHIPPGSALDAACGTGRHAEYLAGQHRDASGDHLAFPASELATYVHRVCC
jgi:hypothetical protein